MTDPTRQEMSSLDLASSILPLVVDRDLHSLVMPPRDYDAKGFGGGCETANYAKSPCN